MKRLNIAFQVIRRINQRAAIGINANVDDRIAHAIGINPQTGNRAVIRLISDKSIKQKFTKSFAHLPEQAVVGLTNALLQCSRNAKVLQYEADQLNEKLSQRQFPASPEEVQEARRQIKQALIDDDSQINQKDSVGRKILEGLEEELQVKVNKLLRKTRYNWKPLTFKTREHAAAYVLARLAPNYAEVHSVLQEFNRKNFVPNSVLDYGSGSGAGFWAAYALWNNKVESYQLIEPDQEMSQFAMDMIKSESNERAQTFIHPNVSFRRVLAPSLQNSFDLVIVHRVLIELASEKLREDLIENLWKRTKKYLVIIEGSTVGGFDAIMAARDYILMGGCELHREQTKQILASNGLLNQETEDILDDQTMSNYIRYMLIKDMLPPKTALPTRVETGHVFAPCPHDQGCPKAPVDGKSVCKFRTRWSILRADGRKKHSNTNVGAYSYVIMAKEDRPRVVPYSRLLTAAQGDGHVTCELCTPFSGIQKLTASRRMGGLYKTIKRANAGELFPVETKVLCSDSEFDLFNEAVSELSMSENTEKAQDSERATQELTEASDRENQL